MAKEEKDILWSSWFNIKKLQKHQSKKKKKLYNFGHYIVTDGISISAIFKKIGSKLEKKTKKKKKLTKEEEKEKEKEKNEYLNSLKK